LKHAIPFTFAGAAKEANVQLGKLVHYATLAPSNHNTHCWKFLNDEQKTTVAVLPDLEHTCPVVVPTTIVCGCLSSVLWKISSWPPKVMAIKQTSVQPIPPSGWNSGQAVTGKDTGGDWFV
jgi:hypothetical protein